jgi:hypothetical protein
MENKQTDLEEVIQEVEQETPQVEEATPELDLEKFDSKDNPDIIKVDLSKPPPTNEVEENNSDNTRVARVDEDAEPAQSEDQVQTQGEAQEEVRVLEEVNEFKEEVSEALDQAEATGQPLPEGVQKLVDFIADTGGSLEDYVRLNRDVKDIDDQDALREYYSRTKPHLDSEEINFLLEDKFSYDEELDEAKDIKRKKLALKEQVAEAKAYLDGQKSKYYEEIKAGSNLTKDQQKAVDFFNRYNKESEQNQQAITRQRDTFNKKTEQLFNDKFKGFEYNVGNKVYRFNVNDVDQVKETQSDINNMFKKFLDENEAMSDAKGYHRSLFTAMNADTVAQHFYEQGKADAIKETMAKSKNVNMDPRQSHNSIEAGGIKVKVLGDDSSSYGFKIKNKK